MQLIIVTGMSGAGKSQAVRALEDIGFYCVDNMPPKLLQTFAELCRQSAEPIRRVALVMDVRSGAMFADLRQSLAALEQAGQPYRILFLDCADETLCHRYKETRRRHPLAGEGDRVEDALKRERALLAPLAEQAQLRVDTTLLSTAQLKKQIVEFFSDEPTDTMTVRCVSFGFKYGTPSEADMLFDVRCFPNPFYVPQLKMKTGLDEDVRRYVLQSDDTLHFLANLYALLDQLLPLYINEGKSQLVIAIGCTGGKHRSVTIAEELSRYLRDGGYRVLTDHRDIDKT